MVWEVKRSLPSSHPSRQLEDHPWSPPSIPLLFPGEGKEEIAKVTFEELRQQVALFAAAMRKMGVRRGDRVVGGCFWLLSLWEQGTGWEEMWWSWVRLPMALCLRVLHKLDQEG